MEADCLRRLRRWCLPAAAPDLPGNKSEARKARDAFQKELDEHRAPRVEVGTVGEILEEFWRKHAWRTPGARRKAREDLDTYLIPRLGHIKVGRFDEKPIEALYASLQAGGDQCRTTSGRPMADTTLRRLHATLRSALNWAVKRKMLASNPALIVEVPAEPAPHIRVPDPEEVLLLCAEAVGEFGVFVRAAVATGRRRQDLLALRLNDLKPHEPALVFDERVTLQDTDDLVTVAQRKLLVVLADGGGEISSASGRAVTELMHRTGHPTVVSLTRALRRLEARGLIVRATQGRRTSRIGITPEGRAALQVVPTASSGVLVERLDKNQRSARVAIDWGTMEVIEGHVEFLSARAADSMDVKTGHGLEDSVAGHEFQAQRDRGSGHPSVGLVDLLGQRVSSTARLGTDIGAPIDKRLVGLDDVEIGEGSFELAESQFTPASADGAVAELGDGDKRHDPGSTVDDAASGLSMRRGTRIEEPACDVGVNDDVRCPPSLDHASARAV